MLLNHVNGILEVLIDVAVKRSLEKPIFFFSIFCQKSHIVVNQALPPTHHLECLGVALS